MTRIYLAAVGAVAPAPVDWIQEVLEAWFPFPTFRMALPLPAECLVASRQQYSSVELLRRLAAAAPRDTERILGVTEGDLSIPMLTFLFGQAQLDGKVALVSLCRLRQEFYQLPSDAGLLRERAVKEALHEMGHTFGLTHCPDAGCPMSLSTDIELVDAKGERYCPRCGAHLARRFARMNGGST